MESNYTVVCGFDPLKIKSTQNVEEPVWIEYGRTLCRTGQQVDACSKVLEVYDKNLESELTMLDDMNGHAGMKRFIEEGYEVISM